MRQYLTLTRTESKGVHTEHEKGAKTVLKIHLEMGRFYLQTAKKPSITGLFVTVSIVSILTFSFGGDGRTKSLMMQYFQVFVFNMTKTAIFEINRNKSSSIH